MSDTTPEYQREARRVDAMRRLSDGAEKLYWEGYRRGLIDSHPNINPEQIERNARAYDLTDETNTRDHIRAVSALGYYDGLRWTRRGGLPYKQRLTVEEWLAWYGPLYGVTSPEYVRQMCRAQEIGRSNTVAGLPAPWTGDKRSVWFITNY